jgi:hypothetical protein
MKSTESANQPQDPLETSFHGLRPAPLPAELRQRLLQARPDLERESARPHRLRFPAWGLLTAAAAVVALGSFLGWPPAHPAAADRSGDHAQAGTPAVRVLDSLDFFPAQESRQQLLSVRDLGVGQDSQKRAVRLISTTWLDENTYGEPGEKPVLQESRFRHEIVPVLLPVY